MRLARALGFRDLLLFYIVSIFSLRWTATAAAVGPSALVVWVIAAVGLFVPLVVTVLELSARYPNEGGIYVWSREAFGPFAGFMTGWTYWTANLPYFPGLLYFAAANALFIGGPSWQSLSSSSTYFALLATAGLLAAVVLNVAGLGVAKWLSNVGGIAAWIPALLLIGLGLLSWALYGPAVVLSFDAFVPSAGMKDVVFWSTIAFAFAGVEAASIMGEEIRDARRTVPRAVLASAVIITVLYMAATFCILVAIPQEQVSGLQGIMQAVEAMAGRLGLGAIVPVVAMLVSVSALGGVGAWFAATARLPFVAGLDRFLPPAFGRLHPRWGTPHVALLTQAVVAGLFVLLGQAGTSVRGAYDALVSMGIITYFIPYLFMFAVMIKVQGEPLPPGAWQVPGGRRVAIFLAVMGWLTTAASIVFAAVPPDDQPQKILSVVKVVGGSVLLVAIGGAVYLSGRRRVARAI